MYHEPIRPRIRANEPPNVNEVVAVAKMGRSINILEILKAPKIDNPLERKTFLMNRLRPIHIEMGRLTVLFSIDFI